MAMSYRVLAGAATRSNDMRRPESARPITSIVAMSELWPYHSSKRGFHLEAGPIAGHEYGLRLSVEETRALIAFLKTL